MADSIGVTDIHPFSLLHHAPEIFCFSDAETARNDNKPGGRIAGYMTQKHVRDGMVEQAPFTGISSEMVRMGSFGIRTVILLLAA